MTTELRPGVFQDGDTFYCDTFDFAEVIASYPGVVANDHDRDGAERARELFAMEYPQFVV